MRRLGRLKEILSLLHRCFCKVAWRFFLTTATEVFVISPFPRGFEGVFIDLR
jgi:hypothetical protein